MCVHSCFSPVVHELIIVYSDTAKVTHGFPQNPSPIFQSTAFAIENRPGLENQSLENAMSALNRLEAPSLYPGSESYKKIELAKWLSDWHFVAFLQTTQLFSNVRCVLFPDRCDLMLSACGFT